ncbi:hypothetical protein SAMN06265218_11580 [Fodinibius sediminis]|uniref:Uncharacterized protein n=1 Tax=Fodinibius sediminis TaxID=1214077 RepID=A0A521EF11_9BACT|nr:hypothetical protein SAMN06265218_11580 [Fodinibius sediminis]
MLITGNTYLYFIKDAKLVSLTLPNVIRYPVLTACVLKF